MRVGTKWLNRLLGRKKSRARLTRSGSVLRLASSSSEKNANLKVIFEQAQEMPGTTAPSTTGFVSEVCEAAEEEAFHSMKCEPKLPNADSHVEKVDYAEMQVRPKRLSMNPSPGAVRDLRIYAVTWNMNGKVPYTSLPKLLENGKGDYDLYVIGVQESPVSSLRRRLHPILGRRYNLVAKSVLGSLQLYVFGKSSLHVTGRKVDKVRFRGLGSVIGRQKGAVAASFCIGSSSFLFIASHFAAHENKLKERNVQYMRARKKIFSRPGVKPCSPGDATVEAEEFDRPTSTASRSFVDESDVVVWLGDLNYRIEGSKGLVKSFVKLNLEKLLWKRDQLFNALDQGDAFNGFVEGPLVFKPTYKYDVGTDNYDTSDKARVPSWTDRILIKTRDESPVSLEVENYHSIDGLRTSDHRPVKALLRVTNLSE